MTNKDYQALVNAAEKHAGKGTTHDGKYYASNDFINALLGVKDSYQAQKAKLRAYEDALTATIGNALEIDNDYVSDVLIDDLLDGKNSEMLPEFKRKYWAEGATVLAQYLEEAE